MGGGETPLHQPQLATWTSYGFFCATLCGTRLFPFVPISCLLMLESDWLIHIHITHMHLRNYPYINLWEKLNELF